MRYCAARQLVERQIPQPLGEEAGDIHVKRRRGCESLRVPGPAETLVALRTIRRNVEEVSLLPPDDVVKQSVQQIARARPRTRWLQVGMNDDRGDVTGFEPGGI